MFERTLLIGLACACLAGCFPQPPPPVLSATNVRRERVVTERPVPFDTVTVTRTSGAVRLHVTSAKRCQTDVRAATDVRYEDGRIERGDLLLESSEQAPCDEHSVPAKGVDIGLLAGDRLRLLGTTSDEGDLDIPLTEFDKLFAGRTLPASELGQVLVRGERGAGLPIGEILNRQLEINARVSRCEATLAASADRFTLARRLAEVSDLQLQGVVDPRLPQCAEKLYARLLEQSQPVEGSTAPGPDAASTSWLERAQSMWADLFGNAPQGVPPQVQTDINNSGIDPSTITWALQSLPALCKITVNGTAVVGALATSGATQVALTIVMGVLGDDLSDWLTNRCCEMAANTLSDASSTVCETERKHL